MGKLSIARAKALSRPGFYHDSPTLYLSVSPTGSRSWIQRITIEGRRHDLGLGGFPLITPEHARRRAAANRLAVADGKNPLTDKRKVRIPTFRQATPAHHILHDRWHHVAGRDTAGQFCGPGYVIPAFNDSIHAWPVNFTRREKSRVIPLA